MLMNSFNRREFQRLQKAILSISQSDILIDNPDSILITLHKICLAYGIRLAIARIPGDGLYDVETGVLSIHSDVVTGRKAARDWYIMKVFSHELAHCIQHKVTGYQFSGITRFSQVLDIERTAERLAYYIFKQYFGHVYKIHHSSFNAYKSHSDKQFLRAYLAPFGIMIDG